MTKDIDTELMERITTSSEIMGGKAVIRGTRLSVQFILGLLAHGEEIDAILVEYPGLQRDDVLACLSFAAQTVAHSSFVPLNETA